MQTIHCPACTFLNAAGAKTCEMCGSAMRPHQPAAQTAEPPYKKREVRNPAIKSRHDEHRSTSWFVWQGPIVIDADETPGGERDEGADGEGGSVSSTAVAEAPEPHNPFASFSYSEDGAEGDARRPQPVQLGAVKRPPPLGSAQPGKKPKQPSSKNGSKKDCGPAEDFDAMPTFEQRVTFLKWHGVCAGARKRSPPADLQAYRFQLLAAVLISAQAQESMVRAAVETMAGMEGGLTAKALAAMEDTELAGKITSVGALDSSSWASCRSLRARLVTDNVRPVSPPLPDRYTTTRLRRSTWSRRPGSSTGRCRAMCPPPYGACCPCPASDPRWPRCWSSSSSSRPSTRTNSPSRRQGWM